MAEIFKTFMAEAEKMDPKGFAKARGERAEMDALRKDAERYRWLRDAHPATESVIAVDWRDPRKAMRHGDLDAAIDAAMKDHT